jgi:SAM-dependent methyltransferase
MAMGDEPEVFEASCLVCGSWGDYKREEGRPIRETYKCTRCQASLRYRAQAEVILRYFGGSTVSSISELVRQQNFRSLAIYEPGFIGPFRPYFRYLPHYTQSRYGTDQAIGEKRERRLDNQDLMHLTFVSESFDLIISSDIFEHIRKPYQAFCEVHRVLKEGGMHIFSIPFSAARARTVYPVDTSGPQDVFVEPPRYHGSPATGQSLVYTDFGLDMIEELGKIGLPTKTHEIDTPYTDLRRVVTFASTKVA